MNGPAKTCGGVLRQFLGQVCALGYEAGLHQRRGGTGGGTRTFVILRSRANPEQVWQVTAHDTAAVMQTLTELVLEAWQPSPGKAGTRRAAGRPAAVTPPIGPLHRS